MMPNPVRSAAFVACLVAAGPASALSCAVPSVEQAYRNADADPADYVIAVGSLALSGPSNPPQGAVALGGDINNMQGYTQPARFSGEFFTGVEFDSSRQVAVEVNVTCTIAWCGSARSVSDALFFFRVVGGSYVLDEDACPGTVFDQAHPGMLYQVSVCHNEGC